MIHQRWACGRNEVQNEDRSEDEGNAGHQENSIDLNGSSNIGVGMNKPNENAGSSDYEYTWCDRIEDFAAISW